MRVTGRYFFVAALSAALSRAGDVRLFDGPLLERVRAALDLRVLLHGVHLLLSPVGVESVGEEVLQVVRAEEAAAQVELRYQSDLRRLGRRSGDHALAEERGLLP